MPRKKKTVRVENATTALCYVRQSYTRDDNDMNSPERQRDNIRIVCEQNGWTPEWYEDAEGHKSGTKVKNRPGWLALKSRLSDPDIVALVANDLSRLHRKGWRIGDLLDFVDEHDVKLILAAPGKQMDFSTPQGRIVAQVGALFDEWYAVDIAQRAKDSVAYRKKKGITIGIPPFGTVRDDNGYLQPSDEGAWLMPDGTFQVGEEDEPPHEKAVWRPYYQATNELLRRYAENKHGQIAIAYWMQEQGWAFRDRYGNPRPFTGDDVRRVCANWAEYGGIVGNKKARDRHPLEIEYSEIDLDHERAVFPVKLLYRVAKVRKERTTKPRNVGVAKTDYRYTLSELVYCAHCEQLAEKHDNPKLRSRLGGWISNNGKSRRYRHKHGVKCGCTNRSVLCDLIESDFKRLLDLLIVKEDELDFLLKLGMMTIENDGRATEIEDIEARKRAEIALCNRKIDAAIHLYGEGRISKEEYLRRVERNEREIVQWESMTTDSQNMALELTVAMEAIAKIATMWDIADQEDRQGMAQNLFTEIIYDLDTQRIVNFKLKPWADRYLTLRGSLYPTDPDGTDNNDNGDENDNSGDMCTNAVRKPVGATQLPTS